MFSVFVSNLVEECDGNMSRSAKQKSLWMVYSHTHPERNRISSKQGHSLIRLGIKPNVESSVYFHEQTAPHRIDLNLINHTNY